MERAARPFLHCVEVDLHCSPHVCATEAAAASSEVTSWTAQPFGSCSRSIYILDVKNGYLRAHRLAGHSSTIRSLDWSVDGKFISSMDQAYESLIFDVFKGKVSKATHRDDEWLTRTNVLGFAVMGIWPDCSDGTDINAADRSPCGKYVLTSDDSGKV